MSQGRSAFLVALAALAASLIMPTATQAKPAKQYVLKHPKHEHCKAHYVKKVETVKKREHHKTVKVKETFCVHVKPKAKTVVGPPPGLPPAIVRLHAHLDPSFGQNPINPLDVTYSYSASAEQESNGVSEPIPSLPNGVLAFYSEGLLVCSMNVGGETTGGKCTVTYSSYGSHTVDAIYTSSEAATTGTQSVTIEPPPVIPTTTTESVSGGSCETIEVPGYYPEHVCRYRVTPTTSGEPASPPTPAAYEIGVTANGVQVGTLEGSDCGVELAEYDEPAHLLVWMDLTNPYCTRVGTGTQYVFPHEAIRWSAVSRFNGATTTTFPLGWAPSQSEPAPL